MRASGARGAGGEAAGTGGPAYQHVRPRGCLAMRPGRAGSALIIGAGLMGRWHASTVKRLGIPVLGVVDPDVERARTVAARCGARRWYASLDDAFADGKPVAAHVCTPLDDHGPTIARLLGEGVHVLAEKPITQTAEESEGLFAEADRAGLVLCPVHQFVFQRGFLRLEHALERLGPARHMDLVASSAGASGGDAGRAEQVMSDILSHPLSLMRRIVGPEVGATRWWVGGDRSGELRASAECSDTTLGILVSMAGRPTRNTFRVICERGSVHLDLFHGFAVIEPPAVSRGRKIVRPFTFASSSLLSASSNLLHRGLTGEWAYPGLGELVKRFYASLWGDAPHPIDASEALDVARARDAIMSLRA